MQTDYLILGQGICGSFLARELQKKGQSFLVLDEPSITGASRIASGIINPVTGRRVVKTWMIDELMPVAWQAYKDMDALLNIACIREIPILDFFPTPQMRLAFLARLAEDDQYLTLPGGTGNEWLPIVDYDFGYGIIQPAFLVNLQELLPAYRNMLASAGQIREQVFRQEELRIHQDGISYQDITARRIIFCDGIQSSANPWFRNLPFAPNKGEALVVAISGMDAAAIYKKGISIVPWKEGLFWVGSSNEWNFDDALPSPGFLERTTAQLKAFCKLPFSIVDHLSAVRPATIERRPFLGMHPVHSPLGIFNGMGTKGCSLAPYFARKLAGHLVDGEALMPEADIHRFRKMLSR